MSQQIYDQLGDLGSLVMLGSMISGIDGTVHDSEWKAIIETFVQFTDHENDDESVEHFNNVIENINKAHESLGTFENKMEFAKTVLNTFKSSFDEDLRKAIFASFNDIAMADLELHPNEAALLGLYAKHLL
jgi:uncharacterized tellurite resistance protein B-like protein